MSTLRNDLLRRLASALILAIANLAATAAVISWTNIAGGTWNVPANWSPNQVPSTNDIAAVTNAGTYTVALNLSPVISGLVLGGDGGTQTLTTAGQTLHLHGSGNVGARGSFRLANGALSGESDLTVSGTFLWDGGVIDSNAAVTIESGAKMLIGPGANHTRKLHGALTNAGTITWTNSGSLHIGGVLHHLSGGVFDTQWSPSILDLTDHAVIINEGVFRKSASVGTLNCYVSLLNRGIVEVQAGVLVLRNSASFYNGCAFLGAGETWMNSGTNTIQGSIHSENLVLLYNATLAGTGVFSGTLAWGGGGIGEDAALTVATNGHLLISSAAQYGKEIAGSLTNGGRITWQPNGNLVLGGVLHNLQGALFDIQTGNTLIAGGPHAVAINDGTLRRSSVDGVTSWQVPLFNNGTVEVQSGRLDLPGGSRLNDGSAYLGNGIIRMAGGTNTMQGQIHSENLALSGATLAGSGRLSGLLLWNAGSLGADASLTIAPNGHLLLSSAAQFTKFVHGTLTNAGTITWQPSGDLLLGGVLHNLPGALFDLQADRALHSNAPPAFIFNEGLIRKSAGTGNTACYSRLVNCGIVEVASGRLSFAGGFANPSGTVALRGGTFQNAQPLVLAGGLLTGWGTVNAAVTNHALVRPSPTHGILTINGHYAPSLAGITAFVLGGNEPGINQSQLQVIGQAWLRGCLAVEWADGYSPNPNAAHAVMTFMGRKGTFDCANGFFLLGHGRRLIAEYADSSMTLTAIAAPEPTAVPLSVAVANGTALVAWPLEFEGYELYESTDLNLNVWTVVTATANRFLEGPPLPPQKYFRLEERRLRSINLP